MHKSQLSAMFEKELELYESVCREYEQKVVAKMSDKDYCEYSEVLFSTHSCAIEGNSFTIDDSRTLKELGLGMPVPQGRKLYECVEMADHFNAYEYVMQNLQHPLDEAFLKEVPLKKNPSKGRDFNRWVHTLIDLPRLFWQ